MQQALVSHFRLLLAVLLVPALFLAGCGGGGDGATPPPTNTAPVANAGADQNVATGSTVTLDGSGSSDADGDSLTYRWSFISVPSGSNAALSNTSAVKPSFTADVDGTYVLSLIVNDGTTDSAPDNVTITASAANSAPVANAGADQNVTTGSTVTLDGSASSDADGDSLTYHWSFTAKPPGSVAILSSATAVRPNFTADVSGTYVLSLIVNDGTVDSAPDSVVITASAANSAPVANAGADQNVTTGSTVTLDGTASSDADGDPLGYKWSFTTKPAASAATLSNDTAEMPSFTADVSGDYVLTLVVNDGTVDSAPDSVTVTAAAPLAFSTNQAASVVIGQADFSGGDANRGGAVAANTISEPYGNPVVYNGRLYLPDYFNARVLGFNAIPTANGASADFVIGQLDFTTADVPPSPTASNMSGPQTLQVDSGKLFLVDYDFNRLSIYNNVPTAATAMPGTADLVVGQPDLSTADEVAPPTNASLIFPESAAVAGGKLIVTDSVNNRVLIWNPIPTTNGTSATLVLGQPDFTSNTPNNDPATPGIPSARTLSNPTGVWSNGTRLVVADSDNNRVLIWNSFPTANQTAADVVLGQQNFAGSNANDDPSAVLGSPTAKTMSFPYAVFSAEGQLFVADQENSRVLIWNSFPTTNQTAADVVLGQLDFSGSDINQNPSATDTNPGIPAANTFAWPSGLYVVGSKLIVGDSLNNRYLIFDSQ